MDELIRSIVALIAIANPIGAVPVFLDITIGADRPERRRAAFVATSIVFGILTTAALSGGWLLSVFGVSVDAFRCGGGLVILLMGLEMLKGRPTRVQHEREPLENIEDRIIVPFAMPMIAGPGAITTVVTMSVGDNHWLNAPTVLTAVAVLSLVICAVLLISTRLSDLISPRGQRIVTRFFGLILVSIGTQFMLAGGSEFFKAGNI